jgi:hypothetical protein
MEIEGLLSCTQEPATGHILTQMIPTHIVIPDVCKIYFNIFLPSTLRSPKWSLLPLRFPSNIVYAFLISPMRASGVRTFHPS